MLRRIRHAWIIVLLLVAVPAFTQDQEQELPKCHSIIVVTKDSAVDESLLTPLYEPYGFRIMRNGIYDFVIDRKKYFQVLLVDIQEDGFSISEDWYFEGDLEVIPDTVFVSLDRDIDIRLEQIDNGIQGIPTLIRNKKFTISIVLSDQYCGIKDSRIEDQGPGHYYFTKFGWKKVTIVNGNPYLFENNTRYLLRRK